MISLKEILRHSITVFLRARDERRSRIVTEPPSVTKHTDGAVMAAVVAIVNLRLAVVAVTRKGSKSSENQQ